MMCLEDTWFVAAFHSTPMHDPGLKEVQRPARVCVCKGDSVLPFLLSCCCWRRRPPAVRRSRLRAAPPPGACPPESPWCHPVVAALVARGSINCGRPGALLGSSVAFGSGCGLWANASGGAAQRASMLSIKYCILHNLGPKRPHGLKVTPHPRSLIKPKK